MKKLLYYLSLITSTLICCGTYVDNHKVHSKAHKLVKRSIKKHQGVDTFVDDIKESMDFAGREKKIKSMLEGQMLTERHAAKRRQIKKAGEVPHLERTIVQPEVVGEKKSIIQARNQEENLAQAFATSDEVEDADESESDTESGSGGASGEPEDKITTKEKEEKVNETQADRRKLQCRKKCTTPMTYKECAIPRCSIKVGTIKDLCFYLCKHQKEKCEDVCDE